MVEWNKGKTKKKKEDFVNIDTILTVIVPFNNVLDSKES